MRQTAVVPLGVCPELCGIAGQRSLCLLELYLERPGIDLREQITAPDELPLAEAHRLQPAVDLRPDGDGLGRDHAPEAVEIDGKVPLLHLRRHHRDRPLLRLRGSGGRRLLLPAPAHEPDRKGDENDDGDRQDPALHRRLAFTAAARPTGGARSNDPNEPG